MVEHTPLRRKDRQKDPLEAVKITSSYGLIYNVTLVVINSGHIYFYFKLGKV